jgi:hypothetical protein
MVYNLMTKGELKSGVVGGGRGAILIKLLLCATQHLEMQFSGWQFWGSFAVGFANLRGPAKNMIRLNIMEESLREKEKENRKKDKWQSERRSHRENRDKKREQFARD